MTNISLYDPFNTRLSRLVNNLFAHPAMFEEKQPLEIKLDVSENDKNYVVRADVPGVNKEDIKVDIDGNRISISAETRKAKEEKKGETVVYSERYQGNVYRSFTLDCDVEQSQAQAKYADGVLELTLPKKTTASTKRVAVM